MSKLAPNGRPLYNRDEDPRYVKARFFTMLRRLGAISFQTASQARWDVYSFKKVP